MVKNDAGLVLNGTIFQGVSMMDVTKARDISRVLVLDMLGVLFVTMP